MSSNEKEAYRNIEKNVNRVIDEIAGVFERAAINHGAGYKEASAFERLANKCVGYRIVNVIKSAAAKHRKGYVKGGEFDYGDAAEKAFGIYLGHFKRYDKPIERIQVYASDGSWLLNVERSAALKVMGSRSQRHMDAGDFMVNSQLDTVCVKQPMLADNGSIVAKDMVYKPSGVYPAEGKIETNEGENLTKGILDFIKRKVEKEFHPQQEEMRKEVLWGLENVGVKLFGLGVATTTRIPKHQQTHDEH